ncbi:hypothetical protein [Butyrivibrio fibrisolvens]|uniref:hypothetical protein n=1 Tax=Butyrivibrio fibrisolvens TaxID=831 RepID=UPI0012BB87F1|nr:hypothetical protein [Butyrivibrio fibrisolvens]
MATEEDKKHKIDTWAKLFNATTWEEIKMITSTNASMNSTAEKIFATNSDFMIAERRRIREDNIIHERRMKEALAEKDKKIEEQAKELEEKDKKLEEIDKKLEEIDKKLEEIDKELEEKDKELEENDKELKEKAELIARLQRQLEEKGICR